MNKRASVSRGRWTTPQLLHGGVAALCLGALLVSLVAFSGVREHRSAVQTVGKDAAPSIIAAQSIKSSLADLDANVANELMVKPGQNFASIAGYGQRRKEVGDNLIHAAENITYGEAERQPIRALEGGLGDYGSLVSRARTLHERSDEPGALEAYRRAYGVLEETLFPAADALAKANAQALDRSYAQASTSSLAMTAGVIITGGILLALLIGMQVFLTVRMRRLINPCLLAATLLTIGFVFYTVQAFRAATAHLKVAKEDAFTSITALWQARATAYDANTDESRWLFDRAHAADYESAFFAKNARLLAAPGGESYANVAAVTAGPLPHGMQGYLAQEMDNITFAGEQEAAQETIRTFGAYFAADQKIRDLENGGRHADAVAFCISMKPGDSNWAFSQFDKALGHTIDINQAAFRQGRGAGISGSARPRSALPPARLHRDGFDRAGSASPPEGVRMSVSPNSVPSADPQEFLCYAGTPLSPPGESPALEVASQPRARLRGHHDRLHNMSCGSAIVQ